MNILKAILFGIMEGITEWIPISSTAHMKILNVVTPLGVSEEFYGVFEVVIQLGAILALLLIFWNKVWPFGYSSDPLGYKGILKFCKKDKFILWLKIALACIPVIAYELFVKDHVNFVNESNETTIIAISLIVLGIGFIAVELYIKDKLESVYSTRNITFLMAFVIGLTQLVAAIFPGVSRSGATIIAGLLLGISRPVITEFTFELAIPVMFGASLMQVIKFAGTVQFMEVMMLIVGCLVAFVVSLFMIRFIINYIKKHSFTIFGIYRILLGIIILILL